MRKITYLVCLLLLSVIRLSGQIPTPDHYLTSPTTAGLGEYGSVPVSLYTGLPQITVPVYEFKSGVHSIPVTLSYHGGGVRPDRHPGWVGLGWTLTCGGSITRVVQGLPDESDCYFACDLVMRDMQFVRPKMGLFYHDDYVDRFPGGAGLQQFTVEPLNKNTRFEEDENLYYDDRFDSQPDQFIFTLPDGLQGTFYYAGHNNWWVQCSRPVKVVFDINDETNYDTPFCKTSVSKEFDEVRSHSINNFKLIDENGTIYTFGGNNKPESIEYSVGFYSQNSEEIAATTWNLTSIEYLDGKKIYFEYERKNYIVQLGIYENFTRQYVKNIEHIYYNGRLLKAQNIDKKILPYMDYVQGSLIVPSYLRKINDGELSLDFEISESKELAYDVKRYHYNHYSGQQPFSIDDLTYLQYFTPDGEVTANNRGNRACLDSLKWFKLDNIILKDKSDKIIRKFHLDYNINNPSKQYKERLALLALSEIDLNSGKAGKTYNFEYDRLDKLPKYCTYDIDHWDFYKKTGIIEEYPDYTKRKIQLIYELQERPSTGPGSLAQDSLIAGTWDFISHSEEDSKRPQYAAPATEDSKYYKARNADPNVSTYGSLVKITYPTGGYTKFEYENHTYSSKVDSTRNTLTCLNTNQIAGGIRIKKIITSADGTEQSEITDKEYFYYDISKPETNKVSSGILLQPRQYYYCRTGFDWIDMCYSPPDWVIVYSSQSIYPMAFNGDGVHIAYSCVSEKNADGSYSVSYFTNFDDGHVDEPTTGDNTGGFGACFPYSSKAMERGLLKCRCDYSADNEIQTKCTYSYDRLGEATYLNSINVVNHGFIVFYVHGYIQEIFHKRIYTYTMYPTGSTVTEYKNGVAVNSISTESEYSGEHLVTKKTVTYPDNIKQVSEIVYPHNATNMAIADLMLEKHNLSVILKTSNYRVLSDKTQQLDSTIYRYSGTNIVVPRVVAQYIGNYDKPMNTLITYDAYFNPIYIRDPKRTSKTVYVWGYNHLYPIAVINNANVNDVNSALGGIEKFGESEIPDFSKLEQLRTLLPDATITIYKHKPGIGLTECISPDGQRITYHYDGLGRLEYVRDSDGMLLSVREYNFAGHMLSIPY